MPVYLVWGVKGSGEYGVAFIKGFPNYAIDGSDVNFTVDQEGVGITTARLSNMRYPVKFHDDPNRGKD